jgi:hypothetical protein
MHAVKLWPEEGHIYTTTQLSLKSWISTLMCTGQNASQKAGIYLRKRRGRSENNHPSAFVEVARAQVDVFLGRFSWQPLLFGQL